mgnify:CR=1 FL=1
MHVSSALLAWVEPVRWRLAMLPQHSAHERVEGVRYQYRLSARDGFWYCRITPLM